MYRSPLAMFSGRSSVEEELIAVLMSLGFHYARRCPPRKLPAPLSLWVLAAFGNRRVFPPVVFPRPLQGSFPAVPGGSSCMGTVLLWAPSWLHFHLLQEASASVAFVWYDPSCLPWDPSLGIADFLFLVCTCRLSPSSDIYVTVSSMALARSQQCRNSPSNLSSSSETGSGGGTYRQKSMPEG